MTDGSRRICFTVQSLNIGGAERNVRNLAQEFLWDGWSVAVVAFDEAGPVSEELPDDVEVTVLEASRTLTAILRLARWIRMENPDAIIANTTHINVATLVAQRLANVELQTIVVEHSMLSDRIERLDGRKEMVTARLAGLLYPRADGIVAVSDGLAADIASVTGVDRSTVTTIYNPIVTDRLYELASESVSDEWLQSNKIPVLLSVGRLEDRKDIPTLLRAFELLLKQRECRLILCGDGPKRSQLENLATELDISEQVRFEGWVENPYKYMNRADVLVLSSVSEGFANVLVEAMAVGCPVVATDCQSGPAEILEQGKWGELVPTRDEQALSSAILHILDEPLDEELLKQRARDFTVGTAYKQYIRLLDSNKNDEV